MLLCGKMSTRGSEKPETKENYIKSSLQPEDGDGDGDDDDDDEKLDVQNASIKGSEKPTEFFFSVKGALMKSGNDKFLFNHLFVLSKLK